jgi:hypothetical protein
MIALGAACASCGGAKDADTGQLDTQSEPGPADTAPSTTETEAPPTGETGATDTPADTGAPVEPCAPVGTGTFAGPTTIYATAVTCNAPEDHVEYHICAQGPAAGGAVFAEETGNPEPNWSDDHTLELTDSDALGWWTELARRLETGASLGSWAPNVSTLFRCRAHFESTVMTYAFAVYDGDGNVVDCVVWGHDPAAMIDGTLARVNDPPFDLAGCRVLP